MLKFSGLLECLIIDCILTENRLSFSSHLSKVCVFTVRIISVSLTTSHQSDGRYVGSVRVSARLSGGPVLSWAEGDPQSRRQGGREGGREGGTKLKVMTTEMLSVLQNRDSYVFYPLIFAEISN